MNASMLGTASWRLLLLAALAVSGAAAVLAKDGDDTLRDLVLGDYVTVGREPDGGIAYNGSARIEFDGDHLVLRERRGEHQITAAGRFEVPSPPDEGRVLRFLSQDPEPVTMTCIVSSDLDNYARLTCLWLRQGTEPAEPGLEAMFPTAEWPDVAPDKAFKPKGP